jgi:Tol biopolymer transport system component
MEQNPRPPAHVDCVCLDAIAAGGTAMATSPRRAVRGVALVVTAVLAACQAGSTAAPSIVAKVPNATASPAVTAPPPSLPPPPPGRILFEREDSNGEHYFTIKTDGTDERAIYDREGCECAHWMADGKRVMTLDATGHGNYSFMTVLPDGTDRVVLEGPSKTLSLAPGATTLDGRLIAFNGWDDTDPSKTGVYLAAPDLSDLRFVLPLQEGWNAVEPSGISPDGSKVVFFVDTGSDGGINHAGSVFVVNADGTGLRQVSPAGLNAAYLTGGGVPGSLSPDGRHAAFTVDDAVWVVDLDGGDARRITDQTGFVWAVSWSPTGEWITYTRFHGPTTTISLVRPDGTDQREISRLDETDEANTSFWSPDGRYLVVSRDSDASLDGPKDIWLMDLEGRYIGQVTDQPSYINIYGWAPTGG